MTDKVAYRLVGVD